MVQRTAEKISELPTQVTQLASGTIAAVVSGRTVQVDIYRAIPVVRDIRSYGIKVDGTDSTSLVQAAVDDAKLNGYLLYVPRGTLNIANLVLGGATKRWGIVGDGKGATELKRASGGTAMNCASSSVPFTLADFTLNCNNTAVPAGSSHGISIGLASDVTIERVAVTDHLASGIQLYDDAGTHRFFNNRIIDCETSGTGGNGQVGILIANMDRCHIVRCYSTGCNAAPGYAIELKNVSHDCHVTDCIGANSLALLALSSDVASPGVERCTVTGFTGKAGASTVAGYFGGYTQYCVLTNLAFDMASGVGYAIRTQNDVGNSFTNVSARNIGATRSAAFLDQASTDNYVELAHIDNLNTTGNAVEFHNSSTRNRVVLRRMTNPVVRSAGLHTEATFNSSNENAYEHDGYEMYENLTIASGVVSPQNMATKLIVLSGEGGLADSLDTITATYFGKQGKVVALKNANSTPTMTVTSAGNIAPAGGASFGMDDRKDRIVLQYGEDATKWVEWTRANNG